ncbi:MAG: rod shape-determining protein MreC [Candidatus Omnitrophota bacterium]
MFRPTRPFLGVAVLLFFLTALPLSATAAVRGSVLSFLEAPISFSKNAAKFFVDLYYFRRNAEENLNLRRAVSQLRYDRFQVQELRGENERLTKLLNINKTLPTSVKRSFICRVIGRSPSAWNRVLLIDKGARQGVRRNMIVLSDLSLVGKVVEAGSSVSKVLLITDPNSKIGVVIQRTRQEGVLFGTSSGECRVKYLSVDTEVKEGDVVETAGFGGFLPKGLLVGRVERVWKEPGQIYQVAKVRPLTDLSRIEEVLCLE